MRASRITSIGVLFLFLCVLAIHAQSDKLVVMGTLTRIAAVGAETSGWAIELNPVLTVNGKQVSSLEVKFSDSKKLEVFENKTVRATGKLSNAIGMETGQRPILTVSSIKEVKQK